MEILQIKDGTPVDSRMDSQMGEGFTVMLDKTRKN